MIMCYSEFEKTIHMKRRICEFIVDDESLIKIGDEFVWLWCGLQLNQKIRRQCLEYVCISYEKEEYAYYRTIYTIISSKKLSKTSDIN
jgi:uncharacterized membrane protein